MLCYRPYLWLKRFLFEAVLLRMKKPTMTVFSRQVVEDIEESNKMTNTRLQKYCCPFSPQHIVWLIRKFLWSIMGSMSSLPEQILLISHCRQRIWINEHLRGVAWYLKSHNFQIFWPILNKLLAYVHMASFNLPYFFHNIWTLEGAEINPSKYALFTFWGVVKQLTPPRA